MRRHPPYQGGKKHMTLELSHYLVLGAILFAISVVGIFLNRRNLNTIDVEDLDSLKG